MKFWSTLVFIILVSLHISAESSPEPPPKKTAGKSDSLLNGKTLSGLNFRGIGPALMSGRIGDIVINPTRRSTWYVAASSGNVWKTTNAGTTWEAIFDNYGSYSIGCLALDPQNPHVLWVGTGENNSQRSVGYGDGIYKSLDGGKSFKNMGLKTSEHIGKILIDPRDSDVVYVASQGPLWSSGGERGLYKTTDGGKTWKRILHISADTGVSEVLCDPRNPDILYASAYQRRRHVWTLINGGPESAIYKSEDAGANWRKINKGLPGEYLGRIGLTTSPMKPDIVYAIVETARRSENGGFYRSTDRGENWIKMSSYVSNSPQYYQEIFADPLIFDRIYSMDTYFKASDDGGKTFVHLGEKFKHVDNHALAFDPSDPDHLIIGSDGGIYETWDRGQNYHYKANLPLTQFYKIAVDNEAPFYNVFGGTQDNATQGGPSQTTNVHGIRNSDWYVTVFGDGFDPAIDPTDPNIIYSHWQHGGLVRFDRRTGERVDIKPRAAKDGPPLRFNWDSALMISPHSNTRLYFGSQFLFRSDDRGDNWRRLGPDLTRNMDRNTLKVMGRVWGVDAVAKNNSTSFYGSIVAVSESPLQEGLLYVGTDDGLVQVSENGGESWRKVEQVGKVPVMTYVNDIEASLHNANVVYVALNNHKKGDFKPYLMKSNDRGKSWRSISGNLPARGSVYTVAEDHQNPNLLFAGTEFGVFFSVDGGGKWVQLKKGIPTIAVRDLEIQRRENDLVAGTFGRGFYILDDYSPLRDISESFLKQKKAHIFPIKKALMYYQDRPLAGDDKAYQGSAFYTAPNPPYGATITYYIKEANKSLQQIRREKDKKLAKAKKDVPYPSWAALKAEDRQDKALVIITIKDARGNVVRRLKGTGSAGVHRATWDLRYPGFGGVDDGEDGYGPLAMPGTYTAEMEMWEDGAVSELASAVSFEVVPLGGETLPRQAADEVLAFQRKTGELQRAVFGANAVVAETAGQLKKMKRAVEVTPGAEVELRESARAMELRLMDLQERLNGDPTRPRRSEPGMPGIVDRINQIIFGHWANSGGPTGTHRQQYDIAAADFQAILDDLRQLVEVDIPALAAKLDAAGAPWTPGRKIPAWRR